MVQIVQDVAPVGRHWRRPQHTFQVRTRPYQIQPFFIAPVLPGETMKNLLMQSRVVTDPIKHPLLGWWQEYYFFYVRMRDLNVRDKVTAMLLNPTYDLSANGLVATADTATYHPGGTINWTAHCLERVVETYFRDEGEAWDVATLGGLPMATAYGHKANWMDNLMPGSAMPDYDPDDASGIEYAEQYNAWEFMKAQKLTNMSFEDFLKTFGVNAPEEEHKPELVRFVRDWSYPSNTVNPSDGKPSSAVVWSVAERADKDRFFKEHGFLFGVTVTRPKVYMSKQTGAAVSLLDNALHWLPAIMSDRPDTSLKNIAATKGPLPSLTDEEGYWVDVRDLLMYGDQFLNFSLTATDAGLVALPTAAASPRYASAADIDGLFVNPGTDVSPANRFIRQDGIVTLAILGAQQDQT